MIHLFFFNKNRSIKVQVESGSDFSDRVRSGSGFDPILRSLSKLFFWTIRIRSTSFRKPWLKTIIILIIEAWPYMAESRPRLASRMKT